LKGAKENFFCAFFLLVILSPEQKAAWLNGTNYLDFSQIAFELKAEKIQDVQGSLF
jgi:hypothetical protein